jgi:hypothetical protein
MGETKQIYNLSYSVNSLMFDIKVYKDAKS